MVKTRDDREKMTGRVQAAFAKWPTFEAMPATKKRADARAAVKRTPDEFGTSMIVTQQAYVQALYALAYQDAEPIGRQGDFVIGADVD